MPMSGLSNLLINSFNPPDYFRRYILLFLYTWKERLINYLIILNMKIILKVHGKSTIRNITKNNKPRKYICNSWRRVDVYNINEYLKPHSLFKKKKRKSEKSKTIFRYYFSTYCILKNLNGWHITCWWNALVQTLWKCKMAQFLWSGIWQYIENVLFEYAILLVVSFWEKEGEERERERKKRRDKRRRKLILLEVVCWWSNR